MKKIYLIVNDSLNKLFNNPIKGSFGVLFLIEPNKAKENKIKKLANNLINRGLAIVGSWGKDSDSIERIFDDVCVEIFLQKEDQKNIEVLTFSEKDNSIEDTLEFFLGLEPSKKFKNYNSVFIVIIGDHEWQSKTKKIIKKVVKS